MATKAPSKNTQPIGNQTFLFDKTSYMWMIGGVVLILIGFMLMAGGKSPDPHKFNYDEIYSFRRITLAPIVVMLGFAIEIYAIMRKPKEENTSAND
jgi:predicted tellurium resistance membrane protein TerC